jgi:hypothetical protein
MHLELYEYCCRTGQMLVVAMPIMAFYAEFLPPLGILRHKQRAHLTNNSCLRISFLQGYGLKTCTYLSYLLGYKTLSHTTGNYSYS